MRNGFLALATVVACALSISVIAAVAGGPAAKLSVSTKPARCTDPLTGTTAKCWAAVSGSGLQPGLERHALHQRRIGYPAPP